MRYGDTKGTRRKRSKSHEAMQHARDAAYDGNRDKMHTHGPTSINDPWLCGRPFHGIWDTEGNGEATQVEVVQQGITDYTRCHPYASGAKLPVALTRAKELKPGERPRYGIPGVA